MNGPTDFNDLAAMAGIEEVQRQIDQAAPAVEQPAWPEPMMPGSLGTPDFPEDILQGAWGEMARAVSASTQTPPAMAIMCSLGVLSTLLQRRFALSPYGDDYQEPVNIFCASVSTSGTRKSAVMGAFLGPITKWEKLLGDRYRVKTARANAIRSTVKKRMETLNQQAAKCKDAAELKTIREDIEREELEMPEEVRAPRLFTGDTTAERLQAMLVEQSERMAVHSDEPGIFRVMAGAYSGGAQNLDVFLQGHAGSAMRIDRAGRMAHVDKPALTFNLMIQPGMMAEVAGSKGFRDSGLVARFLWAVPLTNVGQRDVRQRTGIDAAARANYEASVMTLLEGWLCEPGKVPSVQVLDLDDAARELWLDFSQYIEDNQGDGFEFEAIRDWTSKLAGATARIAALLELADNGVNTKVVSFDAMDRAIRLARVLIPHAQAAFGLLGTDSGDADAMAVLKWMRSKGVETFTRHEAHKAMQGRFTSVDKLKKAMERLDAMDCVREFNRPNKSAKPSICYRVNPALL